jgi:hypothetical protein
MRQVPESAMQMPAAQFPCRISPPIDPDQLNDGCRRWEMQEGPAARFGNQVNPTALYLHLRATGLCPLIRRYVKGIALYLRLFVSRSSRAASSTSRRAALTCISGSGMH